MAQRSEPGEAEVLSLLRGGEATLLTSGTMLAVDWRRRVVESAGGGVCATPKVYDWNKWLVMLAAGIRDMPVPLGELQEQLLWERVIRAELRGAESSSARGLARHAARAYGLMCEYHIDARELAGEGEEAEALARWIEAMQHELRTMRRVLVADLPERLRPHLVDGVAEKRILLDGFAGFTPVQKHLIRALQDGGVGVQSPAQDVVPACPSLTRCIDREAEYRHVARTIAEHLESFPQARIGVLLSRQVKDAARLRRALDEALLPQEMVVTAMREGLQTARMAGGPLSAAPLVSQLLHLLRLAGKAGAPFAEFSPLLFSPGLKGYTVEREARAGLDTVLREGNRHYIGFKSLLAMPEMQDMPMLASVLKSLLLWDVAARHAGEWVRAVHALLQNTGYLEAEAPGRSSYDIRQLNAFRECLASLVSVDAVSAQMGWRGFLSLLVARCQASELAMPAQYPGLHVLPLEQVASLRFDVVFAIGLDEDALPLPARPAPLLPFSVQRRHGLPGTTASLAYEESVFLWRQVLQSAPVVHASFARHVEDREMGASPLLAGIRIGIADPQAPAPVTAPCEDFEDAPSVPLSPAERIRGGSGIVKDQSACPFRAFATYRLGIAPLGETTPGIEPKAKGSLLHLALEYIWTRIHTQADLAALDEEGLAGLIRAAVEHAWREGRLSVPAATQDFEQKRMVRVLGEWLDVECARPSYSVDQCEKEYRLQLPENGDVRFPVWLKADRIDRDAEGHRILIDYKTGRKQSPAAWIGERMQEPQLPLYSMAEGLGAGDAVCFARVRSGECGFEGLSDGDTGIKGIERCDGKRNRPEDWTELLADWRAEINALAGEFASGLAEVAPRDHKACTYCGLEAVCRIGEIGFADEEIDDAAEDA